MCQLSLVDSGDRLANGISLISMMIEGSRLNFNRDGCGIYNQRSGLRKTEKAASLLTNLGEFGLFNIDHRPVMAHIRQATATYGVKENSPENAHPFDGEHFVVAHNGSLEFKDPANDLLYKDKGMIDSAIFADQLEQHHTGNVVEDIQTTVAMFNGKFAFIIFHKPSQTFYVVRGKTATLWQGTILCGEEIKGIAINTEKATLDSGLLWGLNSLQLLGPEYAKYRPGKESTILALETIYKLENRALVEVGKVVETPKAVAVSTGNFTYGSTYYRGGSGANLTPPMTSTTNGSAIEPTKLDRQVGKLVSWMRANLLEPIQMDYLALTVMGKALIDFNSEDLSQFIEALRTLETRNGKKSRLIWSQMTDLASSANLYHKYKTRLQFPYFMTEHGLLLKIRDELLKEVHDTKEKQKKADAAGEA